MIRDTYSEFITEQIIREILKEGASPSVSEINERYEDFVDDNNISKPLFEANNYHVNLGENSSITKYNSTNTDVQRDLKVAYQHLFNISDQAIINFDRWRTESKLLEGRLDDLNKRVESLLLLASDTAGYFNFIQDNFVDNSKVDLSNTTAYVNVDKGTVSIGTSSSGATRVSLSDLKDENIEFTVLSRNNLVSVISANSSKLKYVVSDVTNFWQEKVYTSKPGPVSTELKINLLTETEISRIDVDLHMSNQNSTIQITPMYSTDNYNWHQLPITTFTRSVIDKSTFQFQSVEAKWVKFIMTKVGFDQVHNEQYSYEFGVDEISFYNEGFTENTDSVFISQPLSVNDIDNNPEQFSRLVLEVCEDIPEDTSIDYYVSVSNDEEMLADSFTSIDPFSRTDATKPTILDFGDLDAATISGIKISYDSTALGIFINPRQSFSLAQSVSSTATTTVSGHSSATRYSFSNSNDRILDHSIASGIQIAQGTLELWRNISLQGNDNEVRENINGWGFSDPYYETVVNVDNAMGYNVDFGGEAVVVDGISKTGQVVFAKGKHSVSVHKNNFKTIDSSGVTNLTSLKSADSLYPYNQRYLVEGFEYPTNYPTAEEKIYRGFDIVAQYFMKEVGVFDLINNVAPDDYSKFALDSDAEDSGRKINNILVSSSSQTPTTVFLLKIDESNPDFANEQFMLRFKSANSLFKYLRFKAVLKTEVSTITPFLDSYRIKISS